jgi:very-short-patch-repair endonuclease
MYEKSWKSVRHDKILRVLSNAIPLEQLEQEKVLGIFAVDIFIPRLKAVLEVDGPSHFMRRIDTQAGGKDVISANLNTHFKHECLRRQGYKVISLKNFMPTCEYLDQLQDLIRGSKPV